MSRKLGALVLAMGILACSMGLKTALSGSHSGTTITAANGPDPMPTPPTTPPPPPSK
jgi:hypothetical protein